MAEGQRMPQSRVAFRGGSVLKSQSLAPARGAGKSSLATALPINPEGFVISEEMRRPTGDYPLRYPPPAALTQQGDISASSLSSPSVSTPKLNAWV